MQSFLQALPGVTPGTSPLIFNLLPSALSNVPFHFDTPAVTRYFADQFPLHLGVHQVSARQGPPPEYTLPHRHEEWNEVNLIISPGELAYRIRLGDDEYTVTSNACIWIPRGMLHAANVLHGTGYYIALRI